MKYLIQNAGAYDFRRDGKRIPRNETRASWDVAEKRVRDHLAALGANEIEVTVLQDMVVFSAGPALKFIIEQMD